MKFCKSFLLNSIVLAVLFLAASCRPNRNLNYFQDQRDSTHVMVLKEFEPKIQPGDRLAITVSALNPESSIPYNQNMSTTTGSSATPPPGYFVDKDGKILFPQFGFIKVAGLSKTDLRDTLVERLKSVLLNPIVTIEYMNFRITVLGEVQRQGIINVVDGRITLLEVIGQSGDITMYGKRDNVMVIREKNGKREFGHVNLLSNEVFKSPYFMMQQNDVVYVEMSNKKPTDADQLFTRNISIVAGVVSVVSTLALLVLNLTR